MQMFYFSYGYTWLIVSLVVPPPSDIMLGNVLFNRFFYSLSAKLNSLHTCDWLPSYLQPDPAADAGGQGPAGQGSCNNSGGVLFFTGFPWVLGSGLKMASCDCSLLLIKLEVSSIPHC